MATRNRTTATDFTGFRIGRLVAVEPTKDRSWNNIVWRCICDCGAETFVSTSNLRGGRVRSCGCLKRELTTKHGAMIGRNPPPEYHIWIAMRNRCRGIGTKAKRNYMARGIAVCERWNDFAAFYADMGQRPTGTTIERINNDGMYSPDNFKWATHREQNRNNRRNRLLTFNGRTQCIADWTAEYGLGRGVISNRIALGWSVADAITTPVRKSPATHR